MTIALFDLSHRDARRLLAGGMPVYLCVNPVEYHGPHLSLHNDRLLSLGVVRDLGERLHAKYEWPIVLADHLEVGVDPCPGPGSRPVRFPVVRELVLESCRALAELGARKVVLVTFHGAPLHNIAIEAGARWLREHGIPAIAPFHALLQLMLDFNDAAPYAEALEPLAPELRSIAAAELGDDFHAGFFETSLSLHWAPASVSPVHLDLPPCPAITPDAKLLRAAHAARAIGREHFARELEYGARALGWTALRPFPGYTCRPSLANAESGAAFARFIVDRFEPIVDDVLHGRAEPPAPIMPWIEWMTGGGRLVHAARIRSRDVLAPSDAA